MIVLNNDYNHPAIPEIIDELVKNNGNAFGSYGLDDLSLKAQDTIRKCLKNENVDVHFVASGTMANVICIDHSLRPWEAVFGIESAHIATSETGAVERTGHEVLTLPGEAGKLTAEQVEKYLTDWDTVLGCEHYTQPKMLYISQSTEFGTLYSKAELIALYETCHKHDVYLMVDGARLGYALGSCKNDTEFEDYAKYTDIFYIGGGKCGALFGEAIVVVNDALKDHFRWSLKQNCGLFAKGYLIGMQFEVLFRDGVDNPADALYFKYTKQADDYALELKAACEEKGLDTFYESWTNQIFIVADKALSAALGKDFVYEFEDMIDDEHDLIRFCTSYSTQRDELDALIAAIKAL